MRPKVAHVAVMTKNREKMVEFYQKVFGLEPKRGFGGLPNEGNGCGGGDPPTRSPP